MAGCNNIPGLYCEEKVGDYVFPVFLSGAKNDMSTSESMVFMLRMDSSFNQTRNTGWSTRPLGISYLQFYVRIEKRNDIFIYKNYTTRSALTEIGESRIGYDDQQNAFLISSSYYAPQLAGTSIKLPQGVYRITLLEDVEVMSNAITGSGQCVEYNNCHYYLNRQTPLELVGINQFIVSVK